MMSPCIFLIFCLVSLLCSAVKQTYTSWPAYSGCVSHEIISYVYKNLRKHQRLELIGTGGGINHTIECLCMGFQIRQAVTTEEARAYLVKIMEFCIANVHDHPEWLPYFAEYPITSSSFEIDLHFLDRKGHRLPLGCVNYVNSSNSRLLYDKVSEKWTPFFLKETYEEAKAIVEAERALQEQQNSSKK